MSKTGIVTGCAGFIGSHLCERLLMDGWTVFGIDDLSSGSRENMKNFLNDPGFSFIQSDVLESDSFDKGIFHGVDCLFHHAGKKMAFSNRFPREDLRTNAEGTLSMLLLAQEAGIKRFTMASSVAVYGNPRQFPTPETAPVLPTMPYGVSKFACEEYCRFWHKQHNVPVVIFRYASVYGPRQALNVGAIPVFIEKIRKGETITLFGDGLNTRPFTFVQDVVEANMLAATSKDPAIVGETFNVGSEESVSLLQLAETIGEALGKKPELSFEPERPGEIKHMAPDVGKIRSVLGFRAAFSLKEGIKKTVGAYAAK